MSRPVQALLLDPNYWSARVEQVEAGPKSWLSSPREDLHERGRWVEEFRCKAHDGEILWGLISYPSFFQGARPCCIRAAGPADPIKLDPAAVEKGTIEILIQAPAGRKLEDRVLDLLRVYHHARRMPTIRAQALAISNEPIEAQGETPAGPRQRCGTPDEVWLANKVLRQIS